MRVGLGAFTLWPAHCGRCGCFLPCRAGIQGPQGGTIPLKVALLGATGHVQQPHRGPWKGSLPAAQHGVSSL